VVAWGCRDRRAFTVFATTLTDARVRTPEKVVVTGAVPAYMSSSAPVTAGLDAGGTATVFAVPADDQNPAQPAADITYRVLAATGR
jgi:hypothetical protein